MKVLACLLLLSATSLSSLSSSSASSVLVSARSLQIPFLVQQQQRQQEEDLLTSPTSSSMTAPLGIPIDVCEREESSFHLSGDMVHTDPGQPQKGQRLTVRVDGQLDKVVREGSRVQVRVRYRRIPLLTREVDLCAELAKLQDAPERCPLQPGEKHWQYAVDLPNEIPAVCLVRGWGRRRGRPWEEGTFLCVCDLCDSSIHPFTRRTPTRTPTHTHTLNPSRDSLTH